MKIDLSGKTAIVTGSTAGIGLAIVKGLAAAGARVVVNGRTEAAVEKAVAALSGTVSSAGIEGFAGDLGSATGCDRLARAYPRCDVLVNNLGIYGLRAATGRPLEEVAAGFVIANRPSSIIRRPASVDEVANMVVYAASPQASATTGAALRVDGGVVDTIA